MVWCPKGLLSLTLTFLSLRAQRAKLLECGPFCPVVSAAVAECASAPLGASLAHGILFPYAFTHLRGFGHSLESPCSFMALIDLLKTHLKHCVPKKPSWHPSYPRGFWWPFFVFPGLLCSFLELSMFCLSPQASCKLFKGMGKIL